MAVSLLHQTNIVHQSHEHASLWIKEYIFDYGVSLKQKEKKRPVFRKRSPQLHIRPSLVKFVKILSDQLRFSYLTCHLCLYIIDQFMESRNITPESCLKLLALVCLILSAKHEESNSLIPKFSILRKMINLDFSRHDYILLEFTVMEYFNWELSLPTAVNFCEYHALFAVLPAEINTFCCDTKSLRAILCALTYDYLDITLSEINFLKFLPSKVAAVCLRAARVTLGLHPKWPKALEISTGYVEEDLICCHRLLLRSIPRCDRKRKQDFNSPDTGYFTDSDSSVSPIIHKRFCNKKLSQL